MSGSYIDSEVWGAVNREIPFNSDSAIYKKWREERNKGHYLGAPVSFEIETEVGVQQAFASGAVISWTSDARGCPGE